MPQDNLLKLLEEIQSKILCDKRFNIRDDFSLFNMLACAVKIAHAKEKKSQR